MKHKKLKIWSISTSRYSYLIEIYDTYAFSYSFGSKNFGKIPTREDVRKWVIDMENNQKAK